MFESTCANPAEYVRIFTDNLAVWGGSLYRRPTLLEDHFVTRGENVSSVV